MTYNFDPEFADIVPLMPKSSFEDYEQARHGIKDLIQASMDGLDTSGLQLEDLSIPGLDGDPDVPCRLYLPDNREGITGALLNIHGGGFVVGDLDTEHAGVCGYAKELGVPILSVDYRLAPEHPFPAPAHDCYAGLLWLHEAAERLNIDPERIAVMGQSAGGGLSASTVLIAKERGGPDICFQCLGIPELDDRLATPSMTQFVDTPLWNRPNAEYSWKYYLGDSLEPGSANVPITAAPARASAEDLKGLPPAFINAMEFDPLRDEAIHYAMTLLAAGVPVELHVYPGTFHGSSMMMHADVSQRQHRDMMAALARALK